MSFVAWEDVRTNHFLLVDLETYEHLDKDMVKMYEEAYKQQPHNEELAVQTFFANVRAFQWKSAQLVCPPLLTSSSCILMQSILQIGTRMNKSFQDDRYLYWTVMCTVLQVCFLCQYQCGVRTGVYRPKSVGHRLK